MTKILAALKAGIEGIKNVAKRWTEKTATTMAISYVLSAIHAKHPDWTLPSDKNVIEFAGMLISAHTAHEAWEAVKYSVATYLQLVKTQQPK